MNMILVRLNALKSYYVNHAKGKPALCANTVSELNRIKDMWAQDEDIVARCDSLIHTIETNQ